jgi:Sulfotransferase family
MISHRHKTVFVHIPKCGGQSVEAAFLKDLGLRWRERAPLLLGPNEVPSLGPPRLAHLLARDYVARHYLSDELFTQYFTFAIVRSPIARVLSFYHYLGHKKSLSHFVQQRLVRSFEARHHFKGDYYFLRPQVDYLTDASGQPLLDRAYRLEDLDAARAEIAERAGLATPIPHNNRSTPSVGRADLTSDDLAVIRALYRDDFEALGYDDAV